MLQSSHERLQILLSFSVVLCVNKWSGIFQELCTCTSCSPFSLYACLICVVFGYTRLRKIINFKKNKSSIYNTLSDVCNFQARVSESRHRTKEG